jgi:hypothetical protein
MEIAGLNFSKIQENLKRNRAKLYNNGNNSNANGWYDDKL